MKLPGWCIKCKTIKTVAVSGNGMAMLASGNIVHGICDACAEKEQKR
jgi:hypothetical protein